MFMFHSEYDEMGWVILSHNKAEINTAGDVLLVENSTPEEYEKAINIVNNWRACHAFPLNTLQVRLRTCARKVCQHPLVVQRTKRISSIIQKLQRMDDMTLWRMQDIGGCRAVVDNVAQAYRMKDMYASSRLKHELRKVNDYIKEPKADGYRSLHLIYRFKSKKYPAHNDRQIEIQLRTKLQHAWATSVETASTFLGDQFKYSQGDLNWLNFFKLASSAFSLMEKTPPLLPTGKDLLVERVKDAMRILNIKDVLTGFGMAVKIMEDRKHKKAHYYLLSLDPKKHTLMYDSYAKEELKTANEMLFKLEKERRDTEIQTLLVAADSVNALKRSYPNYFVDTKFFIESIEKFVA